MGQKESAISSGQHIEATGQEDFTVCFLFAFKVYFHIFISMHVFASVCHMYAGVGGGQQRVSDPLQLELQEVMT